MKIKFFKTKKNFKNGSSQINPDIYWKFVLYISFLLVISFFAFGFYFFTKTDEIEDVSSLEESKSARTVKKERINKVLEYFSEREKNSRELDSSMPTIVDPSL